MMLEDIQLPTLLIKNDGFMQFFLNNVTSVNVCDELEMDNKIAGIESKIIQDFEMSRAQ